MKLMPILTLAIAFAIAISMVQLSGIGPYISHTPDSDIDDEFEGTASNATDEEFDPGEGGDSLLGSTVAALNVLMDALGIVAYLPSTIQSIGFPGWFAEPVGRIGQLVMILGIAQLVRGFEIR